MKKTFSAYASLFALGFQLIITERAKLVSSLIIYSTLLTVFHAIYRVMPIAELGVAGLTRGQLIWYFAMTETVILSATTPSRYMALVIEDGGLVSMMQRPRDVLYSALAQGTGEMLAKSLILFSFAAITLPLLAQAPLPLPLQHIPVLFLSIFLGGIVYQLLGYAIATLEILGPYSRPMGWVMGKLIFVCGGLFFPVAFFPAWVQKIVYATPFPAIIYMPASLMLRPSAHEIGLNLLQQIGWIIIALLIAKTAERGMFKHVLLKGD